MSAELQARRTAAAAVLADFRQEADAFIHDDSLTLPTPDYCGWAFRLSSELRSVLEVVEDQAATLDVARDALLDEPQPARLAAIRLVLDSFDWETDDRQYALEAIDDILRGGQ